MALDMKEVLAQKKPIIDAEVMSHLPVKEPRELYEGMRDYPSRGGKRLRPALCLLACEAFGGDPKKALRTAAALEIFQDWILIHDDIEDGSLDRRGKPCLHRIYGTPLAINIGDGLHSRMWEVLAGNRDIIGAERTLDVLEEFATMINETVEGQTYELSWIQKKKWDLEEDDFYKMVRKKTSHYTVITPVRLGAVIAGADEKVLPKINKFGMPMGIAFQIQDDLLNILAEKEKYGKEIGGDIWEGKRSLMLIHLLKHCPAVEKKKVLAIMNKEREKKTADDVAYVLELMKRFGSIDHAKQKAREYALKAKEFFAEDFAHLPETQAKESIRSLIEYVISREY